MRGGRVELRSTLKLEVKQSLELETEVEEKMCCVVCGDGSVGVVLGRGLQ